MKLLQIVSWIVAVCVLAACDSGSEPTPQPKHAEPKTVKVGKGPDALFLTPDERYLYAANVEDSYVSVIDTQSDEVVMTIDRSVMTEMSRSWTEKEEAPHRGLRKR